jgi:hypothetical protein
MPIVSLGAEIKLNGENFECVAFLAVGVFVFDFLTDLNQQMGDGKTQRWSM